MRTNAEFRSGSGSSWEAGGTLTDLTVRAATTADAEAINRIYNAYVHTSTATFDTAEKTLTERLEWLGDHGDDHPVLVVTQDDAVVAWGSLSRWASRCAWQHTVEVSTYVDQEARGKGIGPFLLAALVDAGRARGHHALIAQISADNEPSLKMAARAGFERVGTLQEVGRKFDRWIDLALLELVLADS
jgi:L-amino acid N-acyltransferase